MNDTYPDFKIIKRSLDYKKYIKYFLITSSLLFYTTVIVLMNPLNIPLFDNTKYVPINNGEYIENNLVIPHYDSGTIIFDYSFKFGEIEYHQNTSLKMNFHPTELIQYNGVYRSISNSSNIDVYLSMVYTLEEAIIEYQDEISFINTELNTIQYTLYTETETTNIEYDLLFGFIIYHSVERSENAIIPYSINYVIEWDLETETKS